MIVLVIVIHLANSSLWCI